MSHSSETHPSIITMISDCSITWLVTAPEDFLMVADHKDKRKFREFDVLSSNKTDALIITVLHCYCTVSGRKKTTSVMYTTMTNSNTTWFLASNIMKVMSNYVYNYCPPYLINTATVPSDVWSTSELRNWFSIQKGVRQGCPVSLVSFNLHSEEVMRRSADELGWIGVNISRRRLNNLRFADDVVLTV